MPVRHDQVALRLLSRVNDRPEPGQVRRTVSGSFLDNDEMVARNKPTVSMAVQRVDRLAAPSGSGVKGKQAWKYPGYNIERASSVVINGNYYTDPKEEHNGGPAAQGLPAPSQADGTPRRKQESNFFITINPNRKFDSDLAEVRFKDALKHLQSNEVLARCLIFGPKDSHFVQDRAADVLIPGVDWSASIEEGEKLGRMHTHIIVGIRHFSQIQFSSRMLMHEFRTAFNRGCQRGDGVFMTANPYVQIKLLPQSQWSTIMKQYLRKGMQGQ